MAAAAPALSPTNLPIPAAQMPARSFNARRIIAFIAMVFGMFMSILDIQVVSASLAEIQAGLSASADEITWVQTSYLIAEVIMIPLSGFLSRAFSTRYMFAISAAGFTLMSFMCATSSSIGEMVVWRALQGFIGGGMIPTVFATAYMIFPREKQPVVAPVIGLVATLAPTIGPTIGGYLTDLFSWHWLFLINIGPGIVVTVLTWFLIDFDEPDLSLLENFHCTGLLSMARLLVADDPRDYVHHLYLSIHHRVHHRSGDHHGRSVHSHLLWFRRLCAWHLAGLLHHQGLGLLCAAHPSGATRLLACHVLYPD